MIGESQYYFFVIVLHFPFLLYRIPLSNVSKSLTGTPRMILIDFYIATIVVIMETMTMVFDVLISQHKSISGPLLLTWFNCIPSMDR